MYGDLYRGLQEEKYSQAVPLHTAINAPPGADGLKVRTRPSEEEADKTQGAVAVPGRKYPKC
jgi:hypothetical protein